MPSPKHSTTTRSGQRYYTWRGENYYSVTTMLKGGMPTSYGLQKWQMYTTALGGLQEGEVIAAMLKSCEDPDRCQRVQNWKEVCSACKRILEWLASRPYSLKEKAAELGTDIHEAIEAYVLGKPFPPWRSDVAPRMRQFEHFLKEYRPVFEMTEASVYNRTHRYAGTLDGILQLWNTPDGKPADGASGIKLIADYKSGKAIYEEVALQLAMYRYAEFIGMPDGSEAPMPKVDGAAALHLTDTGYEFLDVQADESIYKFALHVREVYRFQTDVKKHVIRGPLRLDVPAVGPQLDLIRETT